MPKTGPLPRRFRARSARGGLGSGALALLLVCVAGLVLALPLLPVHSAVRPHATLLVLGAAQYNGHPSPAFRARLDHALALYRAGGVQRIVVSGGVGRGDHYSEGEVGQMYLLKRQVPVNVVEAETHSRTTLENLRYSRPLLTGAVTLVTDEVHAPRALALARAVGLRADVSSVPLGAGHWKYRMREKLALLAYTVLGVGDR